MKNPQFLAIMILLIGLLLWSGISSIIINCNIEDNNKLQAKIDSLQAVKPNVVYEPRVIEIVPDISYKNGYYYYTVYLQNITSTRVSDCYGDSARTPEGLINGINASVNRRENEILIGMWDYREFTVWTPKEHLKSKEDQIDYNKSDL